jgi:hypothetical protein
VLLRLAYLGVTNALALLRLLPMSDQAKDAEILALRHQIAILERQLRGERVRFIPADRAFLAALLHRLPRDVLRRIRLLVHPETVLRWHHRNAVVEVVSALVVTAPFRAVGLRPGGCPSRAAGSWAEGLCGYCRASVAGRGRSA